MFAKGRQNRRRGVGKNIFLADNSGKDRQNERKKNKKKPSCTLKNDGNKTCAKGGGGE